MEIKKFFFQNCLPKQTCLVSNNTSILIALIIFYNEKSGQVNICLGKFVLKLLARIGEWHQNLSENTDKTIMEPICQFSFFCALANTFDLPIITCFHKLNTK